MSRIVFLAAVLLLAGCAKLPAGGGGAATQRLIFTLTADREINQNYVYIVAINPSVDASPTNQGPIPVIAPPWGNGFVAGNATHFVRWDPTQSPRYILYKFRDANLIEFFPIGVPVNFLDVNPGTKTIRFELDLTQLADTPEIAATFQSIQVNFLTMDRVPQGTGGSKVWDALGNSLSASEINEWVTIPLRTSGFYDNARFGLLEPTGDMNPVDPDLDIANWSVEVRAQ